MNKFFHLILLAVCLLVVSCSQSYKINVNFSNHDFDGKKAYLTNYDSGDTIDSAMVSDKLLSFTGSVDSAYYARLIVDGNRFGMVVEPGEINVEWGNEIVAHGTPLNEKLNEMSNKMMELDKQWELIEQDYKSGKLNEEQADKKNTELEEKQLALFYATYVSNKDNALGPWAFSNYLMYKQFTATQIDSILNTAPSNYRAYKRVAKAQSDAQALENTAVGKKFTDFVMTSPDGKKQRLSDYIGNDGAYTIVDFWASWCGPCRAEIKSTLTKLHDKYNGNGVKIIGVAVWDKPADTMAAINQLSIPWQVMIDNRYTTEPTDLYGIAGIPHIMVVDPDGIIISRGLQGEPLIQFIDEIMSSK